MPKNLNKNAIKILGNVCRANRPLPIKRIAERTNLSWKTTKEHIKTLESRGLIKCDKSVRRTYCEPSKEIRKFCEKKIKR